MKSTYSEESEMEHFITTGITILMSEHKACGQVFTVFCDGQFRSLFCSRNSGFCLFNCRVGNSWLTVVVNT